MMGDLPVQVVATDATAIDDCWNRIGVRGDKSCPLLVEHVHCRNCDVYASAATRLLDRYSLSQDVHEQVQVQEERAGRSMLLFRLGEEWLALATRCLVEVAPLQPVHSLPHQRSRVLQGVANVRGALVPCLSLADLLGLEELTNGSSSARVMPRMLILAAAGGAVVVRVDEVDGIHGLDPERVVREQGEAHFTAAVLQWRERSVRVLDEEQLLSAVNRSLS
ncbi:chemotaxis protein CheW [Pseudomonas alkylphenolica]|jgi:chemotaxis-related protein WspD|uniref:chemotaxis protein CheW n=1 Tax=Pseudomonas TaxID=286 RepID=UPI0005EBBF99|nr:MULTISPECIES: chemotaxis protein CheW [unclassified Pseudomonas]KJK05221.1 chemotaxis protein CheW [Pseudomonas sp. 5]QYX50141.1 chemotaxis protein CheW [Pseudomonas sp. S11A 273]